jgi:hypothetical protein
MSEHWVASVLEPQSRTYGTLDLPAIDEIVCALDDAWARSTGGGGSDS